jgi:hypothetical protein
MRKRAVGDLRAFLGSSIIIDCCLAETRWSEIMKTVDDAKSIYESELRELLEGEFSGQYVAIVTNPRCHFVRPTFLDAAMAAKEAEPQQIPFVIRIGHDAAFHIGAVSR